MIDVQPDLGGEFDEYSLLQTGSQLRTPSSVLGRSFPQSNQRQYQQGPAGHHSDPSSFELPPGLIHAGEDGYASLPQSPLDLSFGTSAGGIVPGADPVDSVCASYAGCNLEYSGATPAIYDPSTTTGGATTGLVGPGYGVNVAAAGVHHYVSRLPPALSAPGRPIG